ncbi:MAG: vanadium-dependent haloperoxidase [Planctomycetota bacterium]
MHRSIRLAGLVLAVVLFQACSGSSSSSFVPASSTRTSEYNGVVATAWGNLQYDRVREEGLTPPVAARIFGYAGVGLYEAVVAGMPKHRSLVGQLNELTSLPRPEDGQTYQWELVANAALARILSGLFPATSSDSIAALETQIESDRDDVDAGVADRSREYGRALGDAILAWAATDGYDEFNNCDYTPPVGPGLWEPTPPAFAPALQPCWGQIRTFVLGAANACEAPIPSLYSESPSSRFYQDSLEVYETVNNATPEQMLIAEYWADNPGQTGTPPGHWMAIVDDVVTQYDYSLAVAAEAYARVGLAVHDAFVACWYSKYDINLLRPVTYIQNFIDGAWVSPVGTPPFPEYTSGHSVQSGAASTVLTDQFGAFLPFEDDTHVDRGFDPETYVSFEQAANEAAISRLYGGIHYRPACELGVDQGRCIGQAIVTNVVFEN